MSPPRAVARLRRGLGTASLAVLGMCLASSWNRAETRDGLTSLQKALCGQPVSLRNTKGFWFDPEYADFLVEVSRSTPSDATVAVFVPKRPDVYRYQALYQLAPRRVVDEIRGDEADYVAAFRVARCTGLSSRIGRAGEICQR